VPPELVPNAVTLYSANVNLSRLIGPTLAAALVATVGYGWSFTLDSVSYVAVLFALFLMRDDELRAAVRTPRGRGQIRAGLRYLLGVPELWISFFIVMVVGILSYNFSVTLPILVEKALHGSDADFSLVYAAFSAGAVVGTLVIARRTRVTLRTIIVSTAVFGLSMFALAAVPSIAWTYPVAAVVGGTSVAYMTATTAHAQLTSEQHMIGRVLALQTVLLIGTTPLGGPLLGVLADSLGGRVPVVVGGVGAVVAAAIAAVLARRAHDRATG
jgi:predicted MFS family arabinose efflux permease